MKFYLCYPYTFFKKRDTQKSYTPLPAWLTDNRLYTLKQITMRINLIVFFIAIAMFKVTASVKAQTINLIFENAPIEKVFSAIEKQSNYIFWYDKALLKNAPKVNLKITNANLKEALDQCFKNQPLEYQIVENTIVVKPKVKPTKNSGTDFLKILNISGKVLDENGQVLAGVNVKIKGKNNTTVTNSEGNFTINFEDENAILVFSYLGYKTQEMAIKNNTTITVKLQLSTDELDAVTVVNTGYQQLPKERATGSFVQINNELLNRRVSTNVLDRLDGIASGLIFNKASGSLGISPTNEKLGISIRGRVTIDNKVSADPLVVLDNFPYEGDINNINPNDIESITLLKDAAAASIWGARSGNGVIVITTKKGKLNQDLKIELNSNVTISEKPDLFYSRNFINSSDYIDIEKYLFTQNYYNADLSNTLTYPVISPVVAILAKQRAGTITEAEATDQINSFRTKDIRDQASDYLYQNNINQQYALSLRGGSAKSSHLLSLGYDNNRNSRIGNYYNRLSVNSSNTFKPLKNLELTATIIYNQSNQSSGYSYNALYPYLNLADENGNPTAVPNGFNSNYLQASQSLGFLDWKLRPLQERDLFDNATKTKNLLLRTSARYQILSSLNAEIQYQYQTESGNTQYLQSIDSYDVRNTINIYSQRATTGIFTYPIPLGGILNLTNRNLDAQSLRTQLNYNNTFKSQHNVSAILGAELRDIQTNQYYRTSYGYNDQFGTSVSNINYTTFYTLNPSGTGARTVVAPNGDVTGTTNRYVSYFANGSYTFKDKYIFTLSGRKDGANIFGAKTNDKITPLWSAGLGYEISKEPFYKFSLIPYLKIRATYGYNGNVYNASSYLTATYSTSSLTGAQQATITSAPNPELRWEKIRNKNLGIDFASVKNRVSGSVEIYNKLGSDLIEDALLASSTGFTSFKGNAATVETKGFDVSLNTINFNGKFKWYTALLFNYNRDKVIDYDTKYTTSYLTSNSTSIGDPARSGLYIAKGKSMFGVYSYKSSGLDPANGDPRGFLNGVTTKDYTAIIANNNPNEIIYHGSSRPTHFGSVRNTFVYKGFSISANLTYKFNYYFRKKSINLNYSQLIGNSNVNNDYSLRWQNPGDENNTTVPSMVFALNANRNTFYQNSESLVQKGDHIRLQDISLSYDLNKKLTDKLPFAAFQVYGYINNLGILWRANKEGIDPDVSDYLNGGYNSFPNPTTYSIGIRANFK